MNKMPHFYPSSAAALADAEAKTAHFIVINKPYAQDTTPAYRPGKTPQWTYTEQADGTCASDSGVGYEDKDEVYTPNTQHGDDSGVVAGEGEKPAQPSEPAAPSAGVETVQMGTLVPRTNLHKTSRPFTSGIVAFAFTTNEKADGAIAFGPNGRSARKRVSISTTAGDMDGMVVSTGDDNSTVPYTLGAPYPNAVGLQPNKPYYVNIQHVNQERPDDVNPDAASCFVEIKA